METVNQYRVAGTNCVGLKKGKRYLALTAGELQWVESPKDAIAFQTHEEAETFVQAQADASRKVMLLLGKAVSSVEFLFNRARTN